MLSSTLNLVMVLTVSVEDYLRVLIRCVAMPPPASSATALNQRAKMMVMWGFMSSERAKSVKQWLSMSSLPRGNGFTSSLSEPSAAGLVPFNAQDSTGRLAVTPGAVYSCKTGGYLRAHAPNKTSLSGTLPVHSSGAV